MAGEFKPRSGRGLERSQGQGLELSSVRPPTAAGSPFCLVAFSPDHEELFSPFQICPTNPWEVYFLLCQQSVPPQRSPKSSLNALRKGLRDFWKWVWNRTWRGGLHMLVNPSDNDVITTERERDKEILMRRHACDMPCVIQEGKKNNSILPSHSGINNMGCLATGNTYISSRTGPLYCHVCSFARATVKKK